MGLQKQTNKNLPQKDRVREVPEQKQYETESRPRRSRLPFFFFKSSVLLIGCYIKKKRSNTKDQTQKLEGRKAEHSAQGTTDDTLIQGHCEPTRRTDNARSGLWSGLWRGQRQNGVPEVPRRCGLRTASAATTAQGGPPRVQRVDFCMFHLTTQKVNTCPRCKANNTCGKPGVQIQALGSSDPTNALRKITNP